MSPDLPVAYVLGTFPQASQTFIAREVRGLKAAGLPLLIFALRQRPADVLEEPDRAWYPDVQFTPFAFGPSTMAANLHYLTRAPGRYVRTLVALLGLPHRPRLLALRAIVLFMRAAWVAREIERQGGCRQLHAHFALAQTEVAMAAAALLGCPFSFTAHARDIYATPSALAEKMRAASVVVTCTGYNVEYLRSLCPDLPPSHVRLVHHGVEVAPQVLTHPAAAPPEKDEPPTILAAGRLVEKKGFDTLVDACALLSTRGVAFRCRIFGDGPLEDTLARAITAAGLASSVELPGWAPAGHLLTEMRKATVFAMPSRVTEGGDRDGIPNVVLEAMAARLPVVATCVSGIPEAIRHEATGLLVAAGNAKELADALERVLTDRAFAETLANGASACIAEEFTLAVSSSRLSGLFERSRT